MFIFVWNPCIGVVIGELGDVLGGMDGIVD